MPRSPPASHAWTPPSAGRLAASDSPDDCRALSAQRTTASKAAQRRASRPPPAAVFSPGSEFDSASAQPPQTAWEPSPPRLVFAERPGRAPPAPAVSLRRVLDYAEQPRVLCARERMRKYSCRYCGELLAAGCALGGHVTKFHSSQRRRRAKP